MSIKVSKPHALLLGYLSDWQILVPWAILHLPLPQGLEVRQGTERAPRRPNPQHRLVQAVLGADLGTGTEGREMENLNWGYIQLSLVALAFAGLQIWWVGSVFWKWELARPLSEGEFRKALERIWKKGQRMP